MKNVVKIFGIPMSSLGGVHLISGIAQFEIQFEIKIPPKFGLHFVLPNKT